MSTAAAQTTLDRLGTALATAQGPAEATARDAARMIRRRTRRGVDARGQRLPEYADSTKRRKRRQGKRTAPATLTDTRKMLDRLKVTSRGFRVRRGTVQVVGGTARDRRLLRIHVSDEPRRKIPHRDIRGVSERGSSTLKRLYRGRLLRVVRQAVGGAA